MDSDEDAAARRLAFFSSFFSFFAFLVAFFSVDYKVIVGSASRSPRAMIFI